MAIIHLRIQEVPRVHVLAVPILFQTTKLTYLTYPQPLIHVQFNPLCNTMKFNIYVYSINENIDLVFSSSPTMDYNSFLFCTMGSIFKPFLKCLKVLRVWTILGLGFSSSWSVGFTRYLFLTKHMHRALSISFGVCWCVIDMWKIYATFSFSSFSPIYDF